MNFVSSTERSINILIFKNGDETHVGRRFTVNSYMKTWQSLLHRVTLALNPPGGSVLNLHLAHTGEPISALGELRHGEKYVATTSGEKFKFLINGYRTKAERNLRPCPSTIHYVPFATTRRENLNNTIIYIFSNGVANKPARKFVLTQADLERWDYTLGHIAKHMDMFYGTVSGLYTVVGRRLKGPWQLQNGAYYVAVGYHEQFSFMPYMDYYYSNPKLIQGMRIDEPVGHKMRIMGLLHEGCARKYSDHRKTMLASRLRYTGHKPNMRKLERNELLRIADADNTYSPSNTTKYLPFSTLPEIDEQHAMDELHNITNSIPSYSFNIKKKVQSIFETKIRIS